jgi:integrase
MADPLRHRQTKGAATDMVDLTPPRHIPTLPTAGVLHLRESVSFTPASRQSALSRQSQSASRRGLAMPRHVCARPVAGSRTGTASDALWLSIYGLAMTDNGIFDRIVARTREGMGQPINPHLFRDCAVTSVATDDPANIGIASRLLGHRTGSTTERYYNQAHSVEASLLMHEFLLARRNDVPGANDPTEMIL